VKLPDMPDRIARRPRDKRGYPIPWNVLRADDGTAFFTINDDRRSADALREQRCPLCGERLGKWKWWVGGPRSAFDLHGWFLDLPGHYECMKFALETCPYLAAPKYLGRIDVVNPAKLPAEAHVLLDETQIPERPEVFVAIASDQYEFSERGPLFPYTRPARPVLAVAFWRHGKRIHESEALPILRGIFGAEWKVPTLRD
jgi:hypothetical protein